MYIKETQKSIASFCYPIATPPLLRDIYYVYYLACMCVYVCVWIHICTHTYYAATLGHRYTVHLHFALSAQAFFFSFFFGQLWLSRALLWFSSALFLQLLRASPLLCLHIILLSLSHWYLIVTILIFRPSCISLFLYLTLLLVPFKSFLSFTPSLRIFEIFTRTSSGFVRISRFFAYCKFCVFVNFYYKLDNVFFRHLK